MRRSWSLNRACRTERMARKQNFLCFESLCVSVRTKSIRLRTEFSVGTRPALMRCTTMLHALAATRSSGLDMRSLRTLKGSILEPTSCLKSLAMSLLSFISSSIVVSRYCIDSSLFTFLRMVRKARQKAWLSSDIRAPCVCRGSLWKRMSSWASLSSMRRASRKLVQLGLRLRISVVLQMASDEMFPLSSRSASRSNSATMTRRLLTCFCLASTPPAFTRESLGPS
mmetsp:Transcript_15769/g.39686  ORF Transcript_15769/g.39686 Transcript_15769/m.39686 type:complete len:226 (+) Transcript_15769:917-1594(+)